MKRYVVTKKDVRVLAIEVMAESMEEAVQKVKNKGGKELDEEEWGYFCIFDPKEWRKYKD